MDSQNPLAEAMVINDDGLIEAVGTVLELEKQFPPFEKKINFYQKTIIPGLNDAHIHVWKIGHLRTFMLDLRGTKSIVEMQEKLCDFDKKNPTIPWIMARGINELNLIENRLPNKEDIDTVINHKPVFHLRLLLAISRILQMFLQLLKHDLRLIGLPMHQQQSAA